jgi:hypothetical protein
VADISACGHDLPASAGSTPGEYLGKGLGFLSGIHLHLAQLVVDLFNMGQSPIFRPNAGATSSCFYARLAI